MRTLNDYFLTAKITNISTAGSTFVAVPDGGKIIKILTRKNYDNYMKKGQNFDHPKKGSTIKIDPINCIRQYNTIKGIVQDNRRNCIY